MSNFDNQVNAIFEQFEGLEPAEMLAAIENAKSLMDPETRREFEDVLAVAEARIDMKASIEYWARDEHGKRLPHGLTHLQQLALEFIEIVWRLGFIPIVNCPMGTGKFQASRISKVLTPTGWRLIGDLQVGDQVIGSNGLPTNVIAVHPQGEQELYRVTMSDGASTLCGDDHLWYLETPERRYNKRVKDKRDSLEPNKVRVGPKRQALAGKVLRLKDVKDNLRDKYGNRLWFIPVVQPVHFAAQNDLPVDPYLLGCLIGDGGLTKTVNFTSADEEVIQELKGLVPASVKVCATASSSYGYRMVTDRGKPNELLESLRELDLIGKHSWDKFIPDVYKFADPQSRLNLLQGLMDTDGSANGKLVTSTAEFCTTSEVLAKDVQFVVWSLGGLCKIKPRITHFTHKGEKKAGRQSYRLHIKLPSPFNPFRLNRKAERYVNGTKYPPARSIDQVEFVGRYDCRCITVAAENGLYVTDDFIVTHNSALAMWILAHQIGLNHNLRTQIVCTAEGEAQKRVRGVGQILLSKPFRKIFPHIERDKEKPWNAHHITVKRSANFEDYDFTPEEIEILKEEGADPGSIDATSTAYGLNSQALGSRSELTVGDDLPNEDNAINSPGEGDKADSKIDTKFISRRHSPLGVGNQEYDLTKDPFRALFINTPWAENDCIFRRIARPGYSTILIGVNKDFTGYNVEIWGLPDKDCERLKRKYQMIVDETILADDKPLEEHLMLGPIRSAGYKLGDVVEGYNVYKHYLAKSVFTIPLSRPAEWYARIYKQNPRRFDLMYRCIVLSDQEKAFPKFHNSLIEPSRQYHVDWIPVEGLHPESRRKMIKGHIGRVVNYPKGSHLFASVDLAGVNRAGTVITVMALLPNYKRFLIEVRVGSWSGDEISGQLGEVFKTYPSIHTMFVENAGQQDLWIKEMTKHKEKYAWWMKIKPFITTAKSKNDKMLGVMAMDTAFTNGGFMITNSTGQVDHPPLGDPAYPEGCPCGFCVLIRDCRRQLRMDKVSSDTIMSLWMGHASMPQSIDPPEYMPPDGFQISKSGFDLVGSFEQVNAASAGFMAAMMYGQTPLEPKLKSHFRDDGSEIKQTDADWQDDWDYEYEGDEDDADESKDTDQPPALRSSGDKWLSSRRF